MDRCRSPPARQKRGVDVQTTKLRCIQYSLWKDQSVSHNDGDISIQRRIFRLCVVRLQAFGMPYVDPQCFGAQMNRRWAILFSATRRSRRRYRFDYAEADHIALLDLLTTLPCQVMVSGHPSALYDERLAGWRRLALQVMTQGIVRTEVVWFNFAPDRVHWASCAGRNFTDRQRIKRKAANWGRRYAAMPAGERLAVLAAMMAVEVDGKTVAHRRAMVARRV